MTVSVSDIVNLIIITLDIDPLPATEPLFILADALGVALPATFGAAQIAALCVALLCLLLSGFVSGSEMAYFSLTPAQCEELDETPRGAGIRRLLSEPQRLLATILIANNLVNVTLVVLCNFALGPIFSGMSAVWSFVLQTVLLTFLILLFGEIIPKLYANNNNSGWASFAYPGLSAIYNMLSPLSRLLVKSGTLVRRVVTKQANDITTSDLSIALEITDGTDSNKQMLEGILKFGDTEASEIMTPRVELTDIEMGMTFGQVMKVVLESGYSRMPVYEDTEDNIKGILYSRDLLPYIMKEADDSFEWQKLLRPAYFVPESRQIDDLLEDFRKLKIHMAVVVDEFGGTSGVVTLEDVLEEIVGDIDDEYDEPDTTFKRLRDDTYVFEGRTPLTDFFRITGLDADDYKDVTEDVETLAGMLLAVKGDFPKDKEPLVYGRCRFLILDITDHRITEVRVKIMPDIQEG
ncbi:MAG: gliding motility-associated protein GldE [Muribaculaceae bacterium]|nr:gliding motility-associated protein GldE [Muribaculaceae bacterium]MDE6197385.1 gliding motility-associated protein GldE [Muribaculaceae bacterium]